MPLVSAEDVHRPSRPAVLRVLVVDDQWVVRHAVRAALEKLDRSFVVIDAETGEEALSIMRNVSVCMVFCDIHLPGLSGLEALARAYQGRGEKPFMVLMSGQHSASVIEIGRKVGIYEFLSKPFRPDAVLRVVRAFDRVSRPAQVLLVDDSATARKLMKRIFEKSQFRIALSEAESGKEAIALGRKNRFDVIFLDLNMPGLSGVEAAGALLQDNPSSQIAIVSTEQQASLVRTAQFAGAFAYLKKPFDVKDIDAVFHSAFDLARPNIAPPTHAIFAETELSGAAIDGRADPALGW